jgi:hypothetical protein
MAVRCTVAHYSRGGMRIDGARDLSAIDGMEKSLLTCKQHAKLLKMCPPCPTVVRRGGNVAIHPLTRTCTKVVPKYPYRRKHTFPARHTPPRVGARQGCMHATPPSVMDSWAHTPRGGGSAARKWALLPKPHRESKPRPRIKYYYQVSAYNLF